MRDGVSFCSACGSPVGAQPTRDGWKDTKRFFLAFGLIAAYILGSYLVSNWEDYKAVLAFDLGFFLLVVFMALVFGRSLFASLKPKALSVPRALMYLGMQAVLTLFVLITMPWIIDLFDLEDQDYSTIFLWSPFPLALSLVSTAVFPALTEELAFRGILFLQLDRLSGTQAAIMVTGILFAFVHFSMLSMYWLLLAGLLYGWVRAREGHIWVGVVLHMLHNTTVVVLEFAG